MSFDPLEIANKAPRSVGILYHGKIYRYISCGECGTWFWKSTTDNSNIKRAFCDDECRADSERELTRLRQVRWKENYIRKHGHAAFRAMMNRHRSSQPSHRRKSAP